MTKKTKTYRFNGEKLRSYDDWKRKGRQVSKGERMKIRGKDGTPLFSKSQTHKPVSFSGGCRHYAEDYSDFDLEWDRDFACAMELY